MQLNEVVQELDFLAYVIVSCKPHPFKFSSAVACGKSATPSREL
jgi:hypothetical protein